MASAPSEPRPVGGRLDRSGRLIAADPELETLQVEAGAAMNEPLALPQIAAVAALARKLGTAVARPALAASADHDIELWVRATPDGEDVTLSLEGWVSRAPAAPRLAAILGAVDSDTAPVRTEWVTDAELRIISLSGDLAELLGVDAADVAGQPLTRILRFDEDESGDMPLISAVAARRAFTGQHAHSRFGEGRSLVLDGQIVAAGDGSFAGFRGSAESADIVKSPPKASAEAFDLALDEVLRSPLDRIIESAERIVERSEGPLRSDYANYGTDIAGAARHLLSVLSSMGHEQVESERTIDLTALAAEAVVLLESSAEAADLQIMVDGGSTLSARGEERAVIQILVNLIGNAIRHSPPGGRIHLAFGKDGELARVTVTDEGSGVAEKDRERIFERFERARAKEDGAGLGLAISRRLARSLGGDVTLDSAPGEGARFSLTLPSA